VTSNQLRRRLSENRDITDLLTDFEVIIVRALITEAKFEPFNTGNTQVYDKFALQTGILIICCHF
jgi:hypothetical protein